MSMKLDTWLTVKTFSIWMAILYGICAAAFMVLPTEASDLLWRPMVHAFGVKSLSYVLIGFAEAVLYTALAIWLLVVIHNQLSKNRR